MVKALTRQAMAQLVAQDVPTGTYVNLGIGMPTLVADYLQPAQAVTLHSENGLLGMRALRAGEPVDPDLINATKDPAALELGGAITDHVVSFAMMRGGHLDLSVLGAFQVSGSGDIANWDTGQQGSIPGVGGAMDLVVGAKNLYVMMAHVDREGQPKIVSECTYPLTGCGVVDRIYTDLAVIDLTDNGAIVTGMVPGLSIEALQACTGIALQVAPDCRVLNIDVEQMGSSQ